MKLIKPSWEILEQGSTLNDLYKHIELCGRTCYKSQDKITEDSAKPFVDRMIASKHYAMLEHGTVYLYSNRDFSVWKHLIERYDENKYSALSNGIADYDCYVTTNLRVLVENDWLDDLKYLCEPTMFHKKRRTVKFVCNRQVSHEFVRHRVFSFAQESTRYCNYTKDKFNKELCFIYPLWMKDSSSTEQLLLCDILKQIEKFYFNFIEGKTELKHIYPNGNDELKNHSFISWLPQQAATILPNALKTELIMTGFEDDWNHFFELRALGTTGAPHPQAKELAKPLMEEFSKRGYIKLIL